MLVWAFGFAAAITNNSNKADTSISGLGALVRPTETLMAIRQHMQSLILHGCNSHFPSWTVNNGIVNVIERLSGISQQIEDSIPQSYKDSNAHSSINNVSVRPTPPVEICSGE